MPYAKRTVLDGYPKVDKFKTRDEMNLYFEGDRIPCLLCGHMFVQLEPHLKRVHEISCNDYRDMFGVPRMKGLCSSAKTIRESIRMTALLKDNPKLKAEKIQHLVNLTGVGSPLNKGTKKPKFWRDERTSYSLDDYMEFASRVMSGRTTASVSKDSDMPSGVVWYKRKNPEFSKYWREKVRPVIIKNYGDRRRAKSSLNQSGGKS